MRVRYLDLATGKTAEDSGISRFNLTDNNYSCDCNRAIPFDGLSDTDICDGYKRYIVVGVTPEPMDEPFNAEEVIKEANSEYFTRLQEHHKSEMEKVGNNDLRFEDGTCNGFHHVVLRDADDGDVIIVNEDDVKSLIEKLQQHVQKYWL